MCVTVNLATEFGIAREFNEAPNVGLQLRRADSTRAEGKRLLEKSATAPSAARLCYAVGLRQSYLSRHIPLVEQDINLVDCIGRLRTYLP